MSYAGISIIYNPNSTGDSKAMAEDLRTRLNESGMKSKLIPTKYAGHAREIARRIAQKEKRPLIVSSSGDGGYHEVINGVMDSGNIRAICAVLPAGNANDHSRALHEQPLSSRIIGGHISKLDLIEVNINAQDQKVTEYAHSYVGLGLTPIVATKLNKQSLTRLKEIYIVITTFFGYRSFQIKHDGKIVKLDNLLFANINRMAKVLKLAPKNKPNDGMFEVIQLPAGHKLQLVKYLIPGAVTHFEKPRRIREYEFVVLETMPIQLDGEVMVVEAQSQIVVKAAAKKLRTVI